MLRFSNRLIQSLREHKINKRNLTSLGHSSEEIPRMWDLLYIDQSITLREDIWNSVHPQKLQIVQRRATFVFEKRMICFG